MVESEADAYRAAGPVDGEDDVFAGVEAFQGVQEGQGPAENSVCDEVLLLPDLRTTVVHRLDVDRVRLPPRRSASRTDPAEGGVHVVHEGHPLA